MDHNQHHHPPPQGITTTTTTTNDSLDWHPIMERKPKFTAQAHVITYTSQHCRPSSSSTTRIDLRRWCHNNNPLQYLDVFLNEVLIYILPTHYYTHVIQNLLIFTSLGVVVPLYGVVYHFRLDSGMIVATTTLALLVSVFWIYYNRRILFEVIWSHQRIDDRSTIAPHENFIANPYVTSHHRLPMRSILLRYHHQESLVRRAACCPDLLHRNSPTIVRMDNVLCLDSTTATTDNGPINIVPWKFRLYRTVAAALNAVPTTTTTIIKNTTDPVLVTIPDMTVPSNWTLHEQIVRQWDHPRYTNIQYPFAATSCVPPLVPGPDHPTAIYTTTIMLPGAWFPDAGVNDDDVLVVDPDEYTIVLHGVESAFFLYYNQQYIGFAKDSRLSSEFKIPHHLIRSSPSSSSSNETSSNNCHVTKEATIDVVVTKWCDGTYVEDQDHWYLSGIHRSIEIIRRPSQADIVDFQIQADANGHFECCIEHRRSSNSRNRRVIIARIYNDQQLSADGTQWEEGQCIWQMEHPLLEESTTTSTSKITLVDTIQNVKTWTAETPNLYTLTVSLYYETTTTTDNDSAEAKELKCTQSESCRIGFRTINIVSPGIIYINDRRIKNFAGMNRHEHDPDHGKVVSLRRMEEDICLLK